MSKSLSSYALYLLIAVLVIALQLGDFDGLRSLEAKFHDLMYTFRGDDARTDDIVLVDINDASTDIYGNWPWSYDMIASLIAACGSGKPKAMLVNLDLSSKASEDTVGNTQLLANQISWLDNVVLTYDVALAEYSMQRLSRPDYLYDYSLRTNSDLGILQEDAALNVRKPFLPSGLICEYTDGLGFVSSNLDSDRKLRWDPLVANYDGFYYPSATLLSAALYLGYDADQVTVNGGESVQIGPYGVPTDAHGRLFINFSKPNAFTELSAKEILKETVDLSVLRDKFVIIGVTTSGYQDKLPTPVSGSMSRQEILANSVENIIHGNYIKRLELAGWANIAILIGFGLLCAVTLPRVSLMYRVLILLFSLFILVNLNFVVFNAYNTLTQSLYLGIEMILFLFAAPLLGDTKSGFGLLGLARSSDHDETNREKIHSQPKARAHREDRDVPVRELRESADSPEFQKTEVLRSQPEVSSVDRTQQQGHSSPLQREEVVPAGQEPPLEHNPLPLDEPMGGEESASHTAAPSDRERMPSAGQDSESGHNWQMQSNAVSSSDDMQFNESGQITHLGRYEVQGILGKGAMGTVYRGVDPAINRPVALKTIRLDFVSDAEELAELKERLFREAQAAGKLSHPNIVTIYDVGSEKSLQYIAMEYLEGKTLEEMIKRKTKFSYKIIAHIIAQVCDALDYAHSQGIIHRDIKPANIMVLQDFTTKVMDFGIARVESSSMTRTGIAMGTPNYISPEQLQGKSIDRRCDIFSLGVVIYELLAARRPFRGENLTSLIYSIVNEDPAPPSNHHRNIPPIFDHVVLKALKKDPRERYQKAGELKNALSDFVGSFQNTRK